MIWLAAAQAAETVLLAPGASWRYLDTGVDPGSDWSEPGFDDTAWATGDAPLGYGLAALATVVDSGADPFDRHPVTWFRTTFEAGDPRAFEAVALKLRRDDGAVVYVNGVEVARNNVVAGNLYATVGIYGAEQDRFLDLVLPPGAVRRGTNTVAVELHNQAANSGDLVFDLGVSGWDGPTAITRGPWLQQVGPAGAIVRWRTDGPGRAELWWGPAPMNLPESAVDDGIAFDHELRVTGIAADRDVAYAVGHPDAGVLAGADPDHVFHTAPLPGTRRPIRIWAVGDSGTANANAEAVRDAYRARHPDPLETDLFVLLGDNAYPSGTELEYDAAVFDFYPDWLRQVGAWATLGNHDAYSSHAETSSGPYFDLFTYPTAGELGGEPSGTEAYWSFDYGNVHVVNLDSSGTDRAADGAMAGWLRADLAGTDSDWLLAIFHHPPYSKGSHDSDRETDLVEMREVFLPILEDAGVDLVLSGHSHAYERSMLLDGHYGLSTTLLPEMVLQDHRGDPTVDGPYTKWPPGRMGHEGAVYAVAGSSGQVSGGTLDHPAMVVSLNQLGSLAIEIDGLTLSAFFVDDTAMVRDRFELRKGVTTIVELGGETVGAEDEELAFAALALQRDGSEVPTYQWDWGDGTPGSEGGAASHAWSTEGLYTVLLTATDDRGVQVSDTLAVGIDNHPPEILSATASPDPVEGTPVTFAANAVDVGGDVLVYDWLIEGQRSYGSTVDHTFGDDGAFVATLTVTDDAGRTAVRELPIAVRNLPPELLSTTFGEAIEGRPTTLAAFADDPGLDLVQVLWEFPEQPELGQRVGSVVDVTFPQDGRFPVTIRLRDDQLAETVIHERLRVADDPPVVDGVDVTGDLVEGGVVHLAARAHDPAAADVLVYTWHVGSDVLGGREVDAVFGDDAPRELPVLVVSDGTLATEHPFDPGLENLPPVLHSVDAPRAAREGEEVRVRANATDPGDDDVVGATWTLGELSFEGLAATLWFPDEGDYVVTVEVRDDEGATAPPESWSVAVENVPPRFVSEPPADAVGELRYVVEVADVDPVTLTLRDGPPDARLSDGVIVWDGPGEGRFVVVADDGDGGVVEQAFTASVSAAPPPGCGCATGGGPGGLVLLVGCARWFGRSSMSRVGSRG